jgi:hypothetical protein
MIFGNVVKANKKDASSCRGSITIALESSTQETTGASPLPFLSRKCFRPEAIAECDVWSFYLSFRFKAGSLLPDFASWRGIVVVFHYLSMGENQCNENDRD